MRPRPPSRQIAFLAMLLTGASTRSAPAIGASRQNSPPAAKVEEIDLSAAEAEVTIAPSAVYALPNDGFPDSVVVDVAHGKAYAATEFVAINLFSLLAAGWVEVLALLGVLASIWWLRRVARRPQESGHPYCRRCNYLLTKLQGDICPECGASVAGRGRIIGRRRWPRAILAAGCLSTTVGLYAAFARAAPRLVWPDRWPAWWSHTLDGVARANSKYEWLIQHSRVLSRLVEIDFNAGGSTRPLWTGARSDADHINGLFLSSDASRLTVWHTQAVQVWSLPDVAVRSRLDDAAVALPFPFRAVTQVELSGDGRMALLVGPAPQNQAIGIDVDSHRPLWSIASLMPGDVSGMRILHGASLDRFVVAAEFSDSGNTDVSEWFIDGSQHPNRMRHLATSAYALGPRLARHGLGPLIWASDMDHVDGWNLQTERVEKRLTLPHRSVLLSAWPGDVPRLIVTMLDQDSLTWIVDPHAGRVLARVDGTPRRTRSTEVLADGRTLAVWGYDADRSRKVLQLYDLSSIAPPARDDQ